MVLLCPSLDLIQVSWNYIQRQETTFDFCLYELMKRNSLSSLLIGYAYGLDVFKIV